MTDFAYTARDLSGQLVQGTLSAGTHREAISTLTARELFPLTVKADEKQKAAIRSGRVRARKMATVYNQLAGLLRSGVPLLKSLAIIRDQSSQATLKVVLEDVYDHVEQGSTLAEAMARHPKAFSELATSVVRAGGEGGFLEEALERVAKFTAQQDEMKSRVMGAMAYPILLLTIGSVIVTVLIVFFVPKFEDLFSRLRAQGELPMVTEGLLWLSDALWSYGLLIIAVLVGLGFLVKRQVSTPEGRIWLDRWRLKIPQVGSIYLSLAVARFCRVLGTLLSGGVPIVRSLDISADATGNKVLAAAIHEASENITSGESLAAPLSESGHFPRDVVEMIAVAEQANTLDTVLTQIADSLEKDTWQRLDLFVRMLEPLLLLLLAGVVLVVVMALLLPVLKMSTTI